MSSPTRNSARPPTALTIAGSDSGGGAGLQADLRTFLACRVHGLSAITAVTVQNSLGVSGVYELPAQAVAEQIEAVHTDIGVDAAKTGMLASAAIIEAVADTVPRLGIAPFVVDPVCASQHGDPLLHPDALEKLRTVLLPLATLATPNTSEVALLTGVVVTDRDSQAVAARAMLDLGPEWVIVKGGRMTGPESVDLLTDGTTSVELSAARVHTRHVHGSGDSLASATTAALARGASVPDAVAEGKRFVTESVRTAYPLGGGHGPVGHFWRVGPWP